MSSRRRRLLLEFLAPLKFQLKSSKQQVSTCAQGFGGNGHFSSFSTLTLGNNTNSALDTQGDSGL